jgi:adenine-specific DNA methylase
MVDFCTWEASNDEAMVAKARKLILSANGGVPPKVLDPFAGGGSIPLEALRLGCESHALELNPVAYLILLCTLVYPQKYGQETEVEEEVGGMVVKKKVNRLAYDVERWGKWVLEEARKEIGQFYPPDPDGSVPVAYLWARTVTCPNPACGAEIPLVRQFWLANKANKKIALKMLPERRAKRLRFEVVEGRAIDFDPKKGTMRKGSVTCPFCYQVAQAKFLRGEGKAGHLGERLIAVALTSDGEGKKYRTATGTDTEMFHRTKAALHALRAEHSSQLSIIPDEPLPPDGTLGFRIQKYGFLQWGQMFNPRQTLTLVTLVRKSQEAYKGILDENGDQSYTKAVATYLALAVDRLASYITGFGYWHNTGEKVTPCFARQALAMVWDYAEVNPFSGLTGAWRGAVEWVTRVVEHCSTSATLLADVQQGTATKLSTVSAATAVITDPPYYDAVPYSDLSDFFYVWLKRLVGHLYPDNFATPLTPKREEIVVNPVYRLNGVKDKAFFEAKMGEAFREIYRALKPNGICAVVFAHKTTSAWEALISGLLNAGLTISASWPLHTEMASRLRARESAALASSAWLICKHRSTEAGIGPWKQVGEELEQRVKERLDFFLSQGIKGADAFLSAIGPALEVFGRYERVERITGEPVTVAEFLDTVREVVARHALARVLEGQELGAVDASTAFYVLWKWTYEVPEPVLASSSVESEETEEIDEEEEAEETAVTTGRAGNGAGARVKVPFDDARKLAQAVGAEVDKLMRHGSILQKDKEYVRLLGPEERKAYFFPEVPRYRDHAVRALAQPYLAEELAPQMSFSVDGHARYAPEHPGHARPLTIIDGLHMAVLLWADHQQELLTEFLEKSGMGHQETFWRVAQSLSNLLPLQSREKQLLDGLLGKRDVLERQVAVRQASLFEEEV